MILKKGIKPKIILIAFCLSINISSCTLIKEQMTLEFTKEQCSEVKKNFDKFKIGMSKSNVIPLIGGKRTKSILLNPNHFPEQKTQWEIWLLCQEQPYQWQMIAFDLNTQKLVKVFSDDPDTIGFF